MKSSIAQLEINTDELPPVGISVSLVTEEDTEVLRFELENTVAIVGCGYITVGGIKKPWATVYRTESDNNDHLLMLLAAIRNYFSKRKYDFAYSFAETASLRGILYRLKIDQREQGYISCLADEEQKAPVYG